MMKKRLISSYDEINDTFVGKIDGENGFCSDFDISDGIFLAINKNNHPNSIYVNNASSVFNVPKKTLENSNVKINIKCNTMCIYFSMFIEDKRICSFRCRNIFDIPILNFEIDSNY
ncbi:hypothetical protein [Methanobrevibacter gottschalkii]|uniref:hypothetical protein n=1 Tax=Methanobrevibacter gottschalkii TaxID=190974 RepID=UPI0026F1E828|nr:hypothetical protein [Methanobrevibacter gottschalkii]